MSRDRATPCTAGLVLAAGRATRFGEPKQLAELDGRPLVVHVAEAALAAGLAPLVVVIGELDGPRLAALEAELSCRDAAPAEARVVLTRNPEPERGVSSSLRAGVEALGMHARDARAVAVLLADQPRIEAALIAQVVAEAARSEAAIVRPVHGPARVPGHPVVVARELWPELAALEGDVGARALVERHPARVATVAIASEATPDVDVPADLERLRRADPPARTAPRHRRR